MEDFQNVYIARKKDTEALLRLKTHTIIAFHLGGIALECRLKALLVTYHQISEWGETSNKCQDVMFRQTINNPCHSLKSALKHMPDLYKKAKLDKHFLIKLQKIIYPLGDTTIDYISLRYISTTEPSQEWEDNFQYILSWLDKNQRLFT